MFDRRRLDELASVLDATTLDRLLAMLDRTCREFAGEFSEAIETGDETSARAQAHRLAGALSQYGLDALARAFQHLEQANLAEIARSFPALNAKMDRDLKALPEFARKLGRSPERAEPKE